MSADAFDIALPERMQRRNSAVFLLNNSLYFLVAPVFYVGVLHSAILDSQGARQAVANLPETVYLWMQPLSVLIAWFWPSPRLLRPMLMTSLVVSGAAGLVVAALFALKCSTWIAPALVVHGGVVGLANGVRNMCLWELIGRGLSPQRRARALGWTFGVGPVFALLGSCLSQLVLSGQFFEVVHLRPVPRPWSYVVLFGATVPAMWLSAALVALAEVPPATETGARTRPADVLRGTRQYFLSPLIAAAAAGFLLTSGGMRVMNNLGLFAREAMGGSPERYAGLQLALRFGAKCPAGFALGWIVARFHAKAGLVVATSLCLGGVCWALIVPGKWYLLSFALLGAGELYHVYYLNYIVGCSGPTHMRENTAYTNAILGAVGVLPVVYGALSDRYGLRASFGLAGALLVAALLIVTRKLPRQPVAVSQS
jgi:hypothetical protein